MAKIMLAKKSRRMLARLIDILMLFLLSIGTFFAITPLTFDYSTYEKNNDISLSYYDESGLYIKDGSNYFIRSSFNGIDNIETLTEFEATLSKRVEKVYLLDTLFTFYTEKYSGFVNEYNLTLETFKSGVLKVNSEESNIKDFYKENEHYHISILDSKYESRSVNFVCDAFINATKIVENSAKMQKVTNANKKIMLNSILWILPLLVGFGFIFEFLIPVFSKNGETIGKHIFKIIVVSKDGYKLNKIRLLPRFLVYIFVEVILGVLTFGGTFLISYTMFLFTKKRRAIHDYVAGTCVVDKENSFIFDSRKEEMMYKEKYPYEYEQRFKNK